MKKSLLYIFFLMILFSNIYIVYARQNMELSNPIIEFEQIDKYGLQGFTSIDKYLFVVLEGYDDTKSIIKVFDLETYEEILSYEYSSLGHANDVTYNSKNNTIYVIAGSGSNLVYTFNGDSFQYMDTFNIGLPVRSITYIDDYDEYAVRTVSVGYLYDSKFKLISNLPFIVGLNFNSDIGRQGWAYYNEYIYYTNWSWIRYGGDGSNIIYIYNLKGKLMDAIYINNNIGEIEDIAFYQDKMVLGFNGYDNKVKFYIMDVPDIDVDTQKVVNEVDTEKVDNLNLLWIFLLFFSILSVVTCIYYYKRKKSTNN